MTLASHLLEPPAGTRWIPCTEGEFQTWHLVDSHRPHGREQRYHRLCGSPAHTRIRISVVVVCAACMRRALETPEAERRL